MAKIKICVADDKKCFYKYVKNRLRETFKHETYDLTLSKTTDGVNKDCDIYLVNLSMSGSIDLIHSIKKNSDDCFIMFCGTSRPKTDINGLTSGEFKNNKESVAVLSNLVRTCIEENKKIQHINDQIYQLQAGSEKIIELFALDKRDLNAANLT